MQAPSAGRNRRVRRDAVLGNDQSGAYFMFTPRNGANGCELLRQRWSSRLRTNLFGPPTPGFNHKIPEKITTPDTVKTRIGTLKFVDGVPTAKTTQKVFDHLDFLRGTEVFLNFIPATSMEGIRLGAIERGATRSHQALIFD